MQNFLQGPFVIFCKVFSQKVYYQFVLVYFQKFPSSLESFPCTFFINTYKDWVMFIIYSFDGVSSYDFQNIFILGEFLL